MSSTDYASHGVPPNPYPRRSRLSLSPWLVAAALALSACGSGGGDEQADADVSSEAGAAEQTMADEEMDEETTESAALDSTTSSTEAPTSEDTATEDTATEDTAPTEAVEANFPMVEVLNLVDGSTVQLADELAGGDKPILLWFWAPH